MTAGRYPIALVALGFLPVACAVYNDDSLMPLGGSDAAGSANLAGSAGSKADVAQAGSSPSLGGSAGKTSSGATGGAGTSLGGNVEPGTGGTTANEGGEPAGGAGDGPATGGGGGAANGGGVAGMAGHGGIGAGAGAGGVSGTGGKGGAAGGGTGGMPSGPLCSDHPLTARSSWVASSSHHDTTNNGVASNLLDNTTTRWSTGKAQSGNEWLQIDFGASVTLNHVNLQQGDDINDYPRGYSIIVSNTAKDLSGTVQLTGSGKSGVSTAILLPALASGRYLLIKQTGNSLSWWSAEEIEVSCAD